MNVQYLYSVFLYLFVLLNIICFAFIASYSKNQFFKRVMVLLVILLLSIIAGIRGIDVGRDTDIYYYSTFKRILQGKFKSAHGSIGYSTLFAFIMLFFPNYNVVLFVVAFLSYSLLIWRLWDFRKIASFPFMIFIFYTLWFPLSLNVTRQFLSTSLVFWGSRYLLKKKYPKYITISIIAGTIHSISVLSLIAVPLMIFIDYFGKKITVKKILIYTGIPILIATFCIVLHNYIDYEHYIDLLLTNNKGEWGVMQPLLLISVLFFSHPKHKRKSLIEDELCLVKGKIHLKLEVITLIGIIFSMADYFVENASRAIWYFLIFDILYFSINYKDKNIERVSKLFYIFVGLYTFLMEIIYNGDQIFPYYTFWG